MNYIGERGSQMQYAKPERKNAQITKISTKLVENGKLCKAVRDNETF